jgi:hypothetical protein
MILIWVCDWKTERCQLGTEPLEQHRPAIRIVAQKPSISAAARSLKQASFSIGLCDSGDRNF